MKRETILSALRRLGELSMAEGLKLEVSIYGGAAFMLAYDNRAMTRDVDALIKPKEEGERLVKVVGVEMDLDPDWLNSNVQLFLSPKPEAKRRLGKIEDETGLVVHVPTAKYLLAMKALACRRQIGAYPGDMGDLAFLIKKMGIQTVDQIQEAVNAFYPDDMIPPGDRNRLQQLINDNAKE